MVSATGKSARRDPYRVYRIMELRNTRTTVLNQGDPVAKREEIRQYFHATYTLDEQLYDTLAEDRAFYLRVEPLRHPLIFYLGHTAAFYINKLIVAKLTTDRINPRYESMFAVGVDEMSWDDLNEAHYDWPTVAEVKAYRRTVRDVVDAAIRTLPLTMPIGWESPFWVILMGIEHQRIHIETSSVIIRRMPIDLVRQLPLWEICPDAGAAPQNELLPVPGGRVVLGKPRDHRLYGWDNEYGHQEYDVWDMAASRCLVSNQEYLPFVEDGGYQRQELWTTEGWNWVEYSQARHPLFWIDTPDGYRFRTMAREIDMPWNWPVEVNYLEAKAFCNWLALRTGQPIRLPTEAEWYHLHDLHQIPDQPDWPRAPGNVNLEHWASSCPVDRFRFGDFCDIIRSRRSGETIRIRFGAYDQNNKPYNDFQYDVVVPYSIQYRFCVVCASSGERLYCRSKYSHIRSAMAGISPLLGGYKVSSRSKRMKLIMSGRG